VNLASYWVVPPSQSSLAAASMTRETRTLPGPNTACL